MGYQLGVYRRDRGRDYIDLMLSGKKTVDIKLATRRIPPYERINVDDYLLIKESSGPVVGACKIPWVQYYDFKEGRNDMFSVLMDIWEPLGLRDEEHVLRMVEYVSHNRYATIFGLSEPTIFPSPIHVEKSDRRVWVPDFVPPIDIELQLGTKDFRNPEMGR